MSTAEWQPIETAPRDGTSILVCRDNGCGWDYAVVWWWDEGGDYPWVIGNIPNDDAIADGRPEYWMPLPAPPAGGRRMTEQHYSDAGYRRLHLAHCLLVRERLGVVDARDLGEPVGPDRELPQPGQLLVSLTR